MLSVIIPAYNEGENIERAASALGGLLVARRIKYELIFVDDGSTDSTWRRITALVSANSHVKGVRFSRNFGKEGAIFAGFGRAKGDCAVVIDCDLQHPPELIPQMYDLWKNDGAEVVDAVKRSRGKENLIYKLFAKMFYGAMKAAPGMNLDRASDFKLLDRKVINALLEMPERLTFFRALSSWVGFKRAKVEFDVRPREKGESKWSFGKLFKFAVSNLTSFTYIPMQLMTMTGLIFFIFALVIGINTLVQYFSGTSATGFTTVILLILITGATLMFGMGIVGYYISKIYEEIKCRPRFIITQEAGFDEPDALSKLIKLRKFKKISQTTEKRDND